MRSTLFSGALVALLGLSFVNAGCSDDDNGTGPSTPSTARVMVVHASPDAPAVDLYVDGAKAGGNLGYPNNTGYLGVDAGVRNVRVTVANDTTTVIASPVPIAANTNYTVFASDSVAMITPLFLVDTLTAPAAGKAHVRFVHLSPNAPAVDITLATGTVVFGDREFQEYTSFTPLDAGTYNLEVRLAGTSTVVLALPPVTLTAGKIYTVFARGFAGVTTGPSALGAEIIVNN